MRKIIQTKQFKKDYKKIAAAGRHSIKEFLTVVTLLAEDKPLLEKHRNHVLSGEWMGYKECHIKPDWLLIYKKLDNDKSVVLARTGSHSELF
ncbi:MAG: type II toxin-antitoxin system YafQ family toxin [Gammaproteobacteria bacterium]|nr:type II toxin-antitoxin system YafQ family toxin [Gammaproteobacteria bacterium]